MKACGHRRRVRVTVDEIEEILPCDDKAQHPVFHSVASYYDL